MLNAIFRPLSKWPGPPTPPHERRASPFSAKYVDTLDMLERELYYLSALNIIIECQVERSQIRNDGWMKAHTSVSGPAVILSFKDPADAQYSYPCDTFTSYQANLRAIALALEALRKIDRYGVTRRGEQYQGFKQLPAPENGSVPEMTAEEAAEWIAQASPGTAADLLLADKQYFETMSKLATRRLHPDASGNHNDFVTLQQAAGVLTEHHKR